MATVVITNGDVNHVINTNDLGAAMFIESLSAAFSRTGGAWLPADHIDASVEGTSSVRWIPAATSTVIVTFEGEVPPQLVDLPGFLK